MIKFSMEGDHTTLVVLTETSRDSLHQSRLVPSFQVASLNDRKPDQSLNQK